MNINWRFRKDVGVAATDKELSDAVCQLHGKTRHVIMLYYAMNGTKERSTKELALIIRNKKTDTPVSRGHIIQLRNSGIRRIRCLLKINRSDKHTSGIPVSTEFWDISNRCRNTLESLGANNIDAVLAFDFRRYDGRYLTKVFKQELIEYLAKYDLYIPNS